MIHIKNLYLLPIATLSVLMFFSSCGTNKKGKLRPVSRFTKDLTSKYNGHYNANVIIDEYIASELDRAQDNYDEILPVFSYVVDTSQGESSSLPIDIVKEKMTRLISFKRPSKWTDDAYLTYGKAQYLAGHYDGAENTLKYILQNYQPEDLKFIYYYKEDNTKRRLYAQARLEREEDADQRRRERALQRKMRQLERKKIKAMKGKESKLREKRKELDKKEREKERKEKEKERKEIAKARKKAQKELAKARKKGERMSREEAYARVEKIREEREEERNDETSKKKSKKQLLKEREERLREKRLALQNKNQEKEDEMKKLDSFQLEETILEADIVKGEQDSVSLYEKQARIEQRKKEEAAAAALAAAQKLAKEQAVEDSLRIVAIQDSILQAEKDAAFASAVQDSIAKVESSSGSITYFFEEAYYNTVQEDINEADDGILNKVVHHDPAFFEALYYLALVKNQKGQLYEAETYLKDLFQYKLPKDVLEQSYQAIAEHYIMREDYHAASKAIELAQKSSSISNAQKGRLMFIKGQIMEQSGHIAKAQNAYRKCRKLHPQYEMELRAEIKEITLDQANLTTANMVEELEKLGRNYKNENYQDLIQYELGVVLLKSGELKDGLAALRRSAAANTSRPLDKYKALAMLSDLEYKSKNYIAAYEHAEEISKIPEHPDMKHYHVYTERADKLQIIALGIKAIKEQDSLLSLGALPEKELKKLAKNILKEERQKAQAEQIRAERESTNEALAQNRFQSSPEATPDFFAYNPKLLSSGLKSFKKKWNKRPLVDNWRFSSLIANNAIPENLDVEVDLEELELSDDKYAEIFANVPFDEKSRREANHIIDQSLLAVGRGFRQNNLSLSISNEYLLQLLDRKPEIEIKKEVLFWLYKNAQDIGNSELETRFKTLLEELDPNYNGPSLPSKEEGEMAIKNPMDAHETLYDKAFRLYVDEEYEDAFELTTEMIDSLGHNHDLAPKFKLLKAFILGQLSGRDTYMSALKDVHRMHALSPEGKKAQEILLTLGNSSQNPGDSTVLSSDAELNGFDGKIDYDLHYIMIEITPPYRALGQRNKIEAYHAKYGHGGMKITFTNDVPRDAPLLSDTEDSNQKKPDKKNYTCVQVGNFRTKKQVLEYYNEISSRTEEYLSDPENSTLFIISQKNFRTLTNPSSNKSIEDYLDVFKELYLASAH